MSKVKRPHCTDPEQNVETDAAGEGPAEKQRRILQTADDCSQSQPVDNPEDVEVNPDVRLRSISTSVDQDADDPELQGREEGGDVSQNKNSGFWCTSSGSPGACDDFWDISSSKSYDHAVDDPLFWGPYLSERQWGTVREDYSDNDNWQVHTVHACNTVSVVYIVTVYIMYLNQVNFFSWFNKQYFIQENRSRIQNVTQKYNQVDSLMIT